jgi:hypothetical protein
MRKTTKRRQKPAKEAVALSDALARLDAANARRNLVTDEMRNEPGIDREIRKAQSGDWGRGWMNRERALHHIAWKRRQDAFKAQFPTMAAMRDAANYVMTWAPDLAEGVIGGWENMCDAYHKAKEVEAFVLALQAKGLWPQEANQ